LVVFCLTDMVSINLISSVKALKQVNGLHLTLPVWRGTVKWKPAYLGSSERMAVKLVCVCVCVIETAHKLLRKINADQEYQ